eukprot:comp21003_c0_seq1/m.28185 comp21003_c0_seq1/g.28185  ORF comp21003_c0_seq1/g.28185 comp21003_c0_seq1/m.28185 type:complete len:233 (-) comp21003_c0_seq1:726-1424(-)
MADYWKSNPRHFCDFCKVWIADNKPSRDHHEKGVKHKKAVEDFIKNSRKQGAAKQKEQAEMDKQLEAIEKAALSSYKDDIADDPSLGRDSAYQQQLRALKQKEEEREKAEREKKAKEIEERQKQKAVKAPPPEEAPAPVIRDRHTGLGKWQSVEISKEEEEKRREEQERIEKMREEQQEKLTVKRKEEQITFTQKVTPGMESSAVDAENISFKKRKVGGGGRQVRKKTDDDD